MPTTTFYISELSAYTPITMSGSGLGFYGSNFGSSVSVGAFQDTTFLTNSVGTASGQGVSNTKPDSGDLTKVYHAAFGGTSVPLTRLQNKHAPINIRVQETGVITLTNNKIYIYDRNSIYNNPTGVNCYCAEVIRPNTELFASSNGSGDTTWTLCAGSGTTLSLTPSPGSGGRAAWLDPVNGGTGDFCHDFYVAIGASPNSIGAKTFALYYTGEYAT